MSSRSQIVVYSNSGPSKSPVSVSKPTPIFMTQGTTPSAPKAKKAPPSIGSHRRLKGGIKKLVARDRKSA